jgi:hypothetical protein
MSDIEELSGAWRLAKTIASDLLLYHRDKVVQALKRDDLFEALEIEIQEGRALLDARVSSEILAEHNLLDRAIVDVLIYSQAHILCPLW